MEFPRGELLNTIESKSEIISPQPGFELGIYGMPFSRNDTELHQWWALERFQYLQLSEYL